MVSLRVDLVVQRVGEKERLDRVGEDHGKFH